MKTVIVRHKLKPGGVANNEAFVAAIRDRCDEAPVAGNAQLRGPYRPG